MRPSDLDFYDYATQQYELCVLFIDTDRAGPRSPKERTFRQLVMGNRQFYILPMVFIFSESLLTLLI